MKPLSTVFPALLLTLTVAGGGAAQAPAHAGAGPDPLAWFRAARFGMFVHWGPVALTGKEIGWSRGTQTPREEYDRLRERFAAAEFDADAWARLAKDAGMRYLVLTAKHHDGFCLWDSALTEHDIRSTPFGRDGRDVTAELAAACARHGVRLCFYYSIADWHHPHYTPQSMRFGGAGEALPPGVEPDMDRYVQYMQGQLKELVTRYDPGLIWFDGNWEKPWSQARGEALHAFLRDLDADLIVNNRIGRGNHATELVVGDYLTPEQKLGAFDVEHPWETCMTLCTQWAWKPDDPMKSLATCLGALIRCACGDGNLLFNVGPTAAGVIEPRQAERLREMGAWLAEHGETIYGTRGGPWRVGEWGGSTWSGYRIFLHVLEWPEGDLVLPAFGQRIEGARLFRGDAEVRWAQDDDGRLRIHVPVAARAPIDTVVVLTLAEPVRALAAPGDALSRFATDPRFGAVLSREATLTQSSVAQWDRKEDHARLFDGAGGGPEFAFHTDLEERPWIVIDLGETRSVSGLRITNRPSLGERAAGLALATSTDGLSWQQVWQAEEVRDRWDVTLPGLESPRRGTPARFLRLRVERAEATWLHLRAVEVWGWPR